MGRITMPQTTLCTTKDTKNNPAGQQEDTTEHTCACGETHEHHPGVSHREECTSSQKFSDTCCCGTGQASKARIPCGHGPRCH